MRNRTGIIGESPVGMGEVIFTDVTVADKWRGCGLGQGWD